MFLDKLNRILLEPLPGVGGTTPQLDGAPSSTPAPAPSSSATSPMAPKGEQVQGDLETVVQREAPTAPATQHDPNVDDMAAFDAIINKRTTTTPTPVKSQEPTTPKAPEAVTPPVKLAEPAKPPTTVEPPKGKLDLSKTPFGKNTPPVPPSQQVTPPVGQPLQDNYEGLPPEHVHAFKNMSKEARAVLRPIYEEHRTLKAEVAPLKEQVTTLSQQLQQVQQQPRTVLEHEQGYLLNPDYQQSVRVAQDLSFEADYWADQLAAVEAGEDWAPLQKDAQGNYTKGSPLKADANAKARIMRNLQTAGLYKNQAEQAAQQIAAYHGATHRQTLQQIQALENEYFPFYSDPKGEFAPAVQKALADVHPAFKHTPYASMMAKGNLLIQTLHSENQELRQQVASMQAQLQTREVQKAGPTTTTSASSSINQQQQQEEGDFNAFKQLVGRG